MHLVRRRIECALARLGLAVLIAFAALAVAHAATAEAQSGADPDYWKQTAEHRNTVYRFVYGQSPQTIPSGYDPAAEAEQILRQRQATLPPSSPQAPSLWQQVRGVTVKSALSSAPRALGTVTLVAGTLEAGWKIGSGINAKFLKFGIPDASAAGPANYRWDKIVWTPALTRQWANARWPAQDGWVLWTRQTCCNYTPTDWWFNQECVASPYGFTPPAPFAIGGPVWSGSFCYNPAPPGYTDAFVYYASAPENGLPARGPIEPYTNQPYRYSSPAPTPPPQTTVEQSIENELAKPENSLLRQWLNYELGSPGETDPLGIGPPNASQETLDRTAQLLDSQDTQEKKATGSDTIRNCRVPLWHYTSAANAASIYASKAIRASDEAGVGAPPGAYATTITPLDPGPPGDPWTQVSLAYHLFAQLRPVDGWVLLCSNDNSHFKPVGGLAPPDYWYAPGEADTDVPVEPQAWGVNPMPAK